MPSPWTECENSLTGLDTLLTGRLRACTLCGKPDRKQGLWPVQIAGQSTAVAYALCVKHAADSEASHQALAVLLRARYSDGRPD